MKNRPVYAITSVDHALHLATLLQHEGQLRLTDAATLLGVSRSTAHRLLSMLVYRDFAEQGSDRVYRPGPVLRQIEPSGAPVEALRRLSAPHLQYIVDVTGESANLIVLAGVDTRFLMTVESRRVLRVGDRAGKALPAHLTSGGLALLGQSPQAVVDDLIIKVGLNRTEFIASLNKIRVQGYAVNNGNTEAGVTALGAAVLGKDGIAVAAISVSLPTSRYDRQNVEPLLTPLLKAAELLGEELKAI